MKSVAFCRQPEAGRILQLLLVALGAICTPNELRALDYISCRVSKPSTTSRFKRSQSKGATYLVTAWTNWSGLSFPLQSTFHFTPYDHFTAKAAIPQLLVTTTTNISEPSDGSLIPTLAPGNGVQHVMDRTCDYYETAGGQFLPPEKVKLTGRILKPAPAAPGWLQAIFWILSIPWTHAAIGLVFIIAVVALLWWSVWKLLAARRSSGEAQEIRN